MQAHDYACDAERSVWDFGVEIAVLERSGATNSDLRWLLCKGYADHAAEARSSRAEGRRFRRLKQLSFSAQSVFILTEAGASFARELLARQILSLPQGHGAGTDVHRISSRHVPRWDRLRRELSFNGSLVKRYKLPSPNQEAVLQAFEEEHWPCRVDDPLPPRSEQDSKQRLHDTIKNLNRRHLALLIRFQGDGSGQGIRWTALDAVIATRAVP